MSNYRQKTSSIKRIINPAQKILVVLGPTASGKSDLAVKLAKRFHGEIISADSRQVYRGMDIGSGKVPRQNLKFKNPMPTGRQENAKLSFNGLMMVNEVEPQLKIQNYKNYFFYKDIRHHLLDVASPRKTFTVARYQKLGKKAIKNILKKGKLPIICGGTGFYIDTLVYDYKLPSPPPDKKLRGKLEKLSVEQLFAKLKKLDPRRAIAIDRHNPRRLIRALEIVISTKCPVPELKKESPYDVLKIGVNWPNNILRARIHKRLLARMRQGLIAEVRKLHTPTPKGFGLSYKKLESFGLEYRSIARYLQDKIGRKEMLDNLEMDIWHYAKRQMTWFRDKNINWFADSKAAGKLIDAFVGKRYTNNGS